jgi:hypothetical protein
VAAREATKVKRARKATADSALAKSQARKEGLPMEEQRKKSKGKR